MKIKTDLKDWQVAREVFGKNTKTECSLIKSLRKQELLVSKICDGYYEVSVIGSDEVGWIFPKEMLEL